MAVIFDYAKKFESFKRQPLFEKLNHEQQTFIRALAFRHHLSFQEFRQIVEIYRDLTMWGERDLAAWWQAQSSQTSLQGVHLKNHLFQRLRVYVEELKISSKRYPEDGIPRPHPRVKHLTTITKSDKSIFGICPVASENTVCCNLRTIDAVENCVYGCSYCTIQTFYSDNFVFDAEFAEKLKTLPLQPNRFYHIGSGQSSDSLAWGNRHGILDALCQFAADHPNILLEFKTKSNNIRYFQEQNVPGNIVCSWSLNTPTIIQNEEHFTAKLEQRIEAARLLADRGIKVAFHFHPMVYYHGWQQEYNEVVSKLLERFDPQEVLFVSFGSVTLIKPAIKMIRELGAPTKILQMEMVPDPHGKLTYPDIIKIRLFNTIYEAFTPWRDKVFIYLCMEKASIWEKTLGYVYNNNDEFEQDFALKTMSKLAY